MGELTLDILRKLVDDIPNNSDKYDVQFVETDDETKLIMSSPAPTSDGSPGMPHWFVDHEKKLKISYIPKGTFAAMKNLLDTEHSVEGTAFAGIPIIRSRFIDTDLTEE